MMTADEWTLLSNVIHLYDRQNLFEHLNNLFIERQSTLPIKSRSKPAPLVSLIMESVQCVENLIRHSNSFRALSAPTKHRLLKNNLLAMNGMNVIIIDKFLEVTSNKNFDVAFENLFGQIVLETGISIRKKMDPNILLSKILLFVLLYSSNFSAVQHDPSANLPTVSYSSEAMQVQDRYVTMLWKYMVYRFGFTESVLRYSSMISNVMAVPRALLMLENLSIFHLVMNLLSWKIGEMALSNR